MGVFVFFLYKKHCIFVHQKILLNIMNVYKSFSRILLIFFVVMVGISLPQSVVAQTIKGKVTDAITGEALVGTAVTVAELPGAGGVTNVDGVFSFNIS